ncbi:MAG: CAP domain-containing protein [Candidatus Didemnitutus sp.]|nr:CAP domain-containing protein [Candidatus Didemnitutus sp.]
MIHARAILPLAGLLLFVASGWAAELTDPIDAARLDQALLARAIFDETNRVRVQLGRKPFAREPKLDEAADTQANIGALFRPPSHTNPFPLIATPADRVRFAGLDPLRVSENIALLSIYDVPRNTSVYWLKNDSTLRDSRTGGPVRLHTYASFAKAIVGEWMNSPGHRANIVDEKLRYLGCAVRASKSKDDMDMIFAVQAFFTPRRKNAFAQTGRAPSSDAATRLRGGY